MCQDWKQNFPYQKKMSTFKWNLKALGLYFNHWWHVDDDESSFRQFPLSLPLSPSISLEILIFKSSVLLEILILCPIRERFNEEILGNTRLCIFALVRVIYSRQYNSIWKFVIIRVLFVSPPHIFHANMPWWWCHCRRQEMFIKVWASFTIF